MWEPFGHGFMMGPAGSAFGFGAAAIAVLFLIIALWSVAWKTLAVWHAARNKQRLWMIALLLVNTVGVLEIIYLAWFRKDNNSNGPDELYPFLKDMKNPLETVSTPRSSVKKSEDETLPVAESSPAE